MGKESSCGNISTNVSRTSSLRREARSVPEMDRSTTLRELQHAFGTAREALQSGEFDALVGHAERTGLILTFAALLADRSRCLDEHSRMAHEWAHRAVEALGVVNGAMSRRKLQQEQRRVGGLLAVLDALVTRMR